ncbi:MAG: hypothetical protein O7H41_02720 [Planctomycetota bacterium]|nr:hypothetical protein [Planctomycetota bacterium]
MEIKILRFWVRFWRGLQRGARAFRDERKRNPTHAPPFWPFKYAVWYPTFFALFLSATILVGRGSLTTLGPGGPAFFSFYFVPFMLISYLLLRQQKMIDELRARIRSQSPQTFVEEVP